MSISKFIALTTILIASSIFLFQELFAAQNDNSWLPICNQDNQNYKICQLESRTNNSKPGFFSSFKLQN